MNLPFIQMLKFEAKANQKMWIITTIIGVLLLALTYPIRSPFIKFVSVVPIIMVTVIFTLLSYQESTNKQSMNMYHLIPINQNIKFLTKICITLIAFPLLLLIAHVLSNYIYSSLSHFHETQGIDTMMQNSIYNQNGQKILIAVWFFSQSLCTMLAIIFKKYKILYALLVYYGLQILMTLVFALFISRWGLIMDVSNPQHFSNQINTWIFALLMVVSVVLYAISFRLFKRRQI